jgi:WD40 repeat protein
MITKQLNSARHSWALCTLIVLSMAACSAKERSDLVLVDVDMTEVPTAKTLNLAVLTDATPPTTLKAQTVDTPALTDGIAKIALSQTANMAGTSIFVQVTALENNGVVGTGTSLPVTVESGKNAGPVVVIVKRNALVADAGAPDADTPDAFANDLGPRADTTTGTPDLGSATDGKPDAGADATTLADTAGAADVPVSSDTLGSTDVAPTADVPVDAAVDSEARPDAPLPDTAPEAGSILTTLPTCKRYVHFPNSPQTCAAGSNQENVLVNTTALTPDGKYLVSAANNSWVKIWKVVGNELVDPNIVIVGDSYWVTATLSPNGDLLAVANPKGDVVLYDMAKTIEFNAGVEAFTLPVSKLAHTPPNYDYNQAFFSSDQKHLVVIYPAAYSRMKEGGTVAVWDLAAHSLVREFTFDSDTRAYTVSNTSSAGPLWTVMGKIESASDDAGHSYKTTVSLVDALGVNTTKPTFVVPDSLLRATFSADNRTLALGTSEGGVEIWDLSSLTNIQRIGSPLVQGGTDAGVYGLAFTPDGQFLVAGTWKDFGASSLYVFNLKTSTILKRASDYEPRAFGFAADGSTWAYGLGGCGYLYFCK